MTTLQTAITEAEQLRDRIAGLTLDHPWDANVAKNSAARLDAMLSDLRVAACRMREDQPRVTYDPATDQAVPVEPKCCPLGEPASYTITNHCDSLDRETEQALQAATLVATVLTNPTPETQEAWAEVRELCGINPEFVTITMADGTTRSLTDKEREQLFGAKSLRADVVERFTTADATVIDRTDGTRTTVKLDGTLTIEPQPITESLMRAAQVGWVAVNVRGDVGAVDTVSKDGLIIDFGDPIRAKYLYERCGHYGSNGCYGRLDLVSLAPPEVANV